jgi:hypothetical protein
VNPTQQRIHKFMLEYQRSRGKPPTLDDIAVEIGSVNYRSSVKSALDSMVDSGVVRVDDEAESRRYHALDNNTLWDGTSPILVAHPVSRSGA